MRVAVRGMPLSGTGVAPVPPPVRISNISLRPAAIRWCRGCAHPKTMLRFRLSRAAEVRVPLRVRSHGRWRPVATAVFHGHAGLNRDRIAGDWHRQLLPARRLQLLVEIKQHNAWRTHKTLALTVRSPYATGILHR